MYSSFQTLSSLGWKESDSSQLPCHSTVWISRLWWILQVACFLLSTCSKLSPSLNIQSANINKSLFSVLTRWQNPIRVMRMKWELRSTHVKRRVWSDCQLWGLLPSCDPGQVTFLSCSYPSGKMRITASSFTGFLWGLNDPYSEAAELSTCKGMNIGLTVKKRDLWVDTDTNENNNKERGIFLTK